MNPFFDQQGEIQAVSPPERWRQFADAQEEAEDRKREADRYNKIARAEAAQMMTVARQRAEIWQTGETTEQRMARESEQRQINEAKVEAAVGVLRRLAPERLVQRSSQFYAEHQIARSREAGERGRMVIA